MAETARKVITFAVPCYNSAEYMDKCIESLIACGDDIEVLLIDDGSTKDNTFQKACEWEQRHPGVVHAIHQENRGHGGAVNTGMRNATGLYFKVVDSDDWLDPEAMAKVMEYLRAQAGKARPTDMVCANYVYEKVLEGKRTPISYSHALPVGREFTWNEIGRFNPSQLLLMHSIIYRTAVLHYIGFELPEHCFYVDNIFAYVPLTHVQTCYYLDVDMYRYFIGRQDQSVNEGIMMSRMDQQLRITRVMIDSVDFTKGAVNAKLQRYLENYLAMMMCICSVFNRMIHTDEAEADWKGIWAYLKAKDPALCRRMRRKIVNIGTNLPGEAGRRIGIGGYRIAQKIFKFN